MLGRSLGLFCFIFLGREHVALTSSHVLRKRCRNPQLHKWWRARSVVGWRGGPSPDLMGSRLIAETHGAQGSCLSDPDCCFSTPYSRILPEDSTEGTPEEVAWSRPGKRRGVRTEYGRRPDVSSAAESTDQENPHHFPPLKCFSAPPAHLTSWAGREGQSTLTPTRITATVGHSCRGDSPCVGCQQLQALWLVPITWLVPQACGQAELGGRLGSLLQTGHAHPCHM